MFCVALDLRAPVRALLTRLTVYAQTDGQFLLRLVVILCAAFIFIYFSLPSGPGAAPAAARAPELFLIASCLCFFSFLDGLFLLLLQWPRWLANNICIFSFFADSGLSPFSFCFDVLRL